MAWTYRGRVLLGVVLGFAMVVGLSGPAAANVFDDLCAGPMADMKRIQGLIRVHNAKPRVSSDRGYVAAHNAEARSLNARMAQALSRVRQCVSAFAQVQRNHPLSTFPKPTNDQITKVSTAVKKLTEAQKRAVTRWNPQTYDFLAYGSGKKGMTSRVDRSPPKLREPSVQAVYKALDETRPTRTQVPLTAHLQGRLPPTVGTPDLAYTNGRLVTGVAFDHIIPLRRLVTQRNFLKLTPENMWLVANSPANTQWLSKTSNGSKLSGSSAFISGADPKWIQAQAQLREKAEREVQTLIDVLLKIQKG
ncbi:hypothetical protein ACFY4C_11065 [Actinomadura viridis]|uniref:hypothetical protein n=1 Tax=Actinomadura viridis TaxID=58110 RepID=UPI0036BE2431